MLSLTHNRLRVYCILARRCTINKILLEGPAETGSTIFSNMLRAKTFKYILIKEFGKKKKKKLQLEPIYSHSRAN